MNKIQESRSTARRALIARCALRAGAAAYSAGIVSEALLRWPLNPATTLLSELAARDRGYRRIFQASDVCAGALFAASGLQQTRSAKVGKAGKLAAASLVVFGAATIADAFSPLDYPISHAALRPGTGDGAGDEPWAPSISHNAHFVTTTIAGSASVGICLEHWKLARRAPRRSGAAGVLRAAAAPATVALLLTGVAALASPKLLPGAVQRVQTLAFATVCLDLAALQAQEEAD
ncbi:hypothetical protein AUR04nite_11630 [Glutamicibacter uratoxydans]|uniref:DUF998 domain-containing protein n=1 Tax=Glutamicibacter uratoxydans TaxID=43667 RepID=A0A4Y4DT12_GLUUR|nr:DUF998 domain-containing protein [Glutamicibacter uratoxydans]GED05631.1 hypothetical protein AUR04nite_11630 [Glutamicibacter uratoxydans]